MLSSIHPLGERGRANRWWLTVTSHIVGAAVGGAFVGALVGTAGAVVAALGVPVQARLAMLGAVAVGAAVVDARGWPQWLWRPHRQVDENWMHAFRGWVYGGGYGVQLGMGITTIVTAATLYVVAALAFASGSLVDGMVLGLAFGTARGLTLLAGRAITDTDALFRVHRTLHARAGVGRVAAITADLAVAAGAGALLLVGVR